LVQPFAQRRDGCVDLRAVGNICAKRNRLATRGFHIANRARTTLCIQVEDADSDSLARKPLGTCRANAGGSARDECDSACHK
jgi:hypothetical protein